MADLLKTVNLYIETDLHGPRRQDGTVMYLLEAQTSKGTGTRDKIIPIPDTTEHHLVLEALEEAMGRINQSCQVDVWLQDHYIAGAIDGGLVQRQRRSGDRCGSVGGHSRTSAPPHSHYPPGGAPRV